MIEDVLRSQGRIVVEWGGNPFADLAVVGESLGAEEERLGQPFIGQAGYFLNTLLSNLAISRPNLFVTNVVTIRPPANDLTRLIEYNVKVEDFYPSLKARLEKAKPKCVLALGKVALKALCNLDEPITNWRGSLLESTLIPGLKVIPSFHPAWILRQGDTTAKAEFSGLGNIKFSYGSARATLAIDIQKAWKERLTNTIPSLKYDFRLKPSFEETLSTLAQMKSAPYVAFDIETSFDHNIICIALADSPTSAISIPLSGWTLGELSEIQSQLRSLLWNHCGLIAQNGQFDLTYLQAFAPVRILHFDTMIAHHILYPELPHSLAYLASIYTNQPYYKWMSKTNLPYYNCLDACCTFEVATELKLELAEAKLEDFFYGFSMPLMHNVMRMGWTGIKVDKEILKNVAEENTELAGKKEANLEQEVGFYVNTQSPKQVKELLYDTLHLPKQINSKTGKISSDEKAITKLFMQTGNESLKLILKAREYKKRASIANSKIDFDSRVSTSYSIIGTDTGRLSSRKNVFDFGMNLQNVEPSLRKAFIKSRNDTILIEADLSQAEARLVAWFAQDKSMMDIFNKGEDIHTWNAINIFGCTKEEVTKEKRYFAKRIVHGFDYGLGVDHLRELILTDLGLRCTRAYVENIRNKYFKACPSILIWHKMIENLINTTRTLINPFGRRRMFFGRIGPDLYRKAYAYLPQSTCVDYLNHGLNRIICQIKWFTLLQVHDSILIECLVCDQEQVIDIIEKELSVPIVINNLPLVIPVGIKVGQTWGEMVNI